MRVRVILPAGVLLDRPAARVVAEAQHGSFCLLPRHIDLVAALVPGILAVTAPDGEEVFLALDEGVLVKCGPDVLVSTWNAVRGPLGELRRAVREQSRQLGQREQKARSALGKLEASLVRQVLDWKERADA